MWSPFKRSAPPTILARKASKVGPKIYLQTVGRPAWTPRDYAHMAKESYMSNPISFRCVKVIATAAASLPMLIFENKQELTEHPILSLFASPNPFIGRSAFMEAAYSHLLLQGNAYIEMVLLDGKPREMFGLRPDRMKVVPGPNGYPASYEYTVGNHKTIFEIEMNKQLPILHLKNFHPLDDNYGMSAVEPSSRSVDVHNQAASFNMALLSNSARPSGALVYKDDADKESLTDEQFNRLKSELDENYAGPDNAGKPLLLEGGLEWQEMGLSPKDLEFVEGKREAAREICLAMGVPPMLLGIPGDNTYSNYAEANRALYRQTVIPLVLSVMEEITTWLRPSFGREFSLSTDLDRLEALAAERKDLWDRIRQADFLTTDEKREGVGYDEYTPSEKAGGRILTNMSQLPVEDVALQAEGGGGEPDGDADPEVTSDA